MGTALTAIALAAVLVAPHLLSQQRITPTSGIALWTAVMLLRAAVALAVVVAFIFFVPATELFALLTHWCLHGVIPFLATHLGFDGHSLGAAVVVPALVMAVSLISVAFGAWRGARGVSRWLRRSSLGPGPASSVIIGGSDVVVAAAGLRAPQVVVSAGALVHLDDAELAAGLEHEWGHVRRRHRFVELAGEFCQALSRPLPGGKLALGSLRFHLERDADDYAVRRTGDPLALASAICKAAAAAPGPAKGPALAALGGSGVPERLRGLIGEHESERSRAGSRLARMLAGVMIVFTLGLVAVTPALASSSFGQLEQAAADRIAGCK